MALWRHLSRTMQTIMSLRLIMDSDLVQWKPYSLLNSSYHWYQLFDSTIRFCWICFGPSNGVLPDGTMSLPGLMLASHLLISGPHPGLMVDEFIQRESIVLYDLLNIMMKWDHSKSSGWASQYFLRKISTFRKKTLWSQCRLQYPYLNTMQTDAPHAPHSCDHMLPTRAHHQ